LRAVGSLYFGRRLTGQIGNVVVLSPLALAGSALKPAI
jgi:hypothetical protein